MIELLLNDFNLFRAKFEWNDYQGCLEFNKIILKYLLDNVITLDEGEALLKYGVCLNPSIAKEHYRVLIDIKHKGKLLMSREDIRVSFTNHPRINEIIAITQTGLMND